MHVIGTAGHVDHGKSTLVKALTGIDPDRLAEEKARAMTIDLGFAWLTLGDEEVGIVDVPGHSDFIENMLAGVGGIDLALFVVAADEGVMPQTREHLAILNLLEVPDGVVALTKVDLIDDEEWLELITLDLNEALEGTCLAGAPIIPVSAHSGQGLDALRTTLLEKLQTAVSRPDNGRPRLPIDRVFSLSGFGTVVTGTLLDGRFHLGDAIEAQPTGLKGRIRGLQTHKTKREVALPGSRVAINLTGIAKDELKRGDVIAAPGVVSRTILLDAQYRHLPDADAPLKHNSEVKLFIGASEMIARARVLGARQIEPGADGWLQLALREPVAVARGDRFILRRPSPSATLGGGRILDPHPGRRYRRFRPEVIQRLQTLSAGAPDELLLQALRRLEPVAEQTLLAQAGVETAVAAAALEKLLQNGQVVRLGQQLLSRGAWETARDKLLQHLNAYHRDYPLRAGAPREELRSRLRLPAAVFNPLVNQAAAEGLLVAEEARLRAPGHTVTFSAAQQAAVDALLRTFAAAGVNAPSVKEARAAVGDELYNALVEQGRLRPLTGDVVYAAEEYERYTGLIGDYLRGHGRINAAQARDLLQTSRKYAIALLEHLDEIKVTRRVGDDRELA